MFSDFLEGASNVLSAPRRGMYAVGDAVARGLGYQGPEISSFADILGNAGMEDGMARSTLGFVGDVATDPLTYVGGLGLLKGHKLLKGMAAARGPRYTGGFSKLASSGAEGAAEGQAALAALRQSPHAQRLLQELPEGSRFLGGNNGLAFKTPAGDVVRFGTEEPRLAIGELLQPTRNVKVGNWRAERLPFAENVGNKDLYKANYRPIADSLRGQGLHPADLQPGNLGTIKGRPTLIDPGSVVPHPRALQSGSTFARAPETLGKEGGLISDALLDWLGYTSRLRSSLGG